MKDFKFLLLAFVAVILFASCERVAPNYAGVFMENYGKDGKKDFSIKTGRVSTWEWGTELFQVPLFDQRGDFAEPVTLKAADNTEFKARPTYSYKVIKERAVDVVFDNKHISDGGDFMSSLEDNILEPRIYDLIKEESRKHKTDSLMADGGSLIFERRLEQIIETEFEKRGLQLLTFSAQLEFSEKVREKIDSRNEVNTNISVLDQQIEEQKKLNELEQLKTEQAIIRSRGLTKEILYKQFIDRWDGKTALYGIVPDFLKITK
ncbi:hypothetical protein [Bacteroides thetaiotaomicron]|uniref:SPFH domain / Band 7 family protein n=1 Tax=Bacteroides thetaiotaomicron TaxID=818 RepID=A0A6I0SAN5_BACT4|nr:hypothetical protein GAN98_19645 [Bacteroides thetaiotaomicron]KAB4460973.1 hypothetical protein GAN67_20725 [Bacteroides thetaiotaomicron]KAB4468970.1 hypothetical protein GAN76_21980 [Bacteroides thetaiotaomicron]KAB4470224.1 hypothetical protein GAN59_20470 [Bacteroides thetaiotaomicron]KAB4481619.1 hypothetical protein GAN57_20115 [Bacteroides thetaiotaomicron]